MHGQSPTEALLFVFVCVCFCAQMCGCQDLCVGIWGPTGPHLPLYLRQDMCFAMDHCFWQSSRSLSFQRTYVRSLSPILPLEFCILLLPVLHGLWRFKLGSSHLYNKCLAHCAISLFLPFFIYIKNKTVLIEESPILSTLTVAVAT